MKTKLALLMTALLVIMSISLVSCADSDVEAASESTAPNAVTDTPPDPMEEPTGPFLSIEDEHNSYGANTIQIRVEYIGMIDANSVEIYDFENDSLLAVRLDDESKAMVEKSNLESGDLVYAEYYIDFNDLVVLTSLEKEESDDFDSDAVYAGQIDAGSIEVRDSKKGIVSAYRLSYSLKTRFDDYSLNEGDAISFSFYEDENGSKIITELNVLGQSNRATVIYKGQIDVNSIEVCYPDSNEFRAFRLADILKQNFSEYGLEEEQTITVEYIIDENDSYIITQIID